MKCIHELPRLFLSTNFSAGNIVSDGKIVQDSEGIQNPHFGITKDGKLFFG